MFHNDIFLFAHTSINLLILVFDKWYLLFLLIINYNDKTC